MITYTIAVTLEELQQIIDLQFKNLKSNLSDKEKEDQGFLSVQHTITQLQEIGGKYKHVIAKADNKVIGFALVHLKEFKETVPILTPMFEEFDNLEFNGKLLKEVSYFVMGQICVDKDHRGLGVFKNLYLKLKNEMESDFLIVVTEVASRNRRSLKAHNGVGFNTLFTYVSPDKEQWEIVYWDFK